MAMKFKIPLEVDGLDFEDDATLETIGRHLNDLVWTRINGRTLATLFVDQHPVMRATQSAQRIRHAFPYACIQRVDRDIVGISEIALRASVSSEAVRMWVTGKRGPGHFPTPAGATGGGRKGVSKVWYWGDVNAWLDNQYRLGDGFRYLNDRQHAQITERLTQTGQEPLIAAATAIFVSSGARDIESWAAGGTEWLTAGDLHVSKTQFLLGRLGVLASEDLPKHADA